MAEKFVRRTVALSVVNDEFMCQIVNTSGQYDNFSQFINELIDERRLNEKFDSCQNAF